MSTNERLQRIEDTQMECRERLARQEVILEEIHDCVTPKGSPSITVRLDRVERFQKGFIRTFWAVTAGVITAAAGAVAAALRLKG